MKDIKKYESKERIKRYKKKENNKNKSVWK